MNKVIYKSVYSFTVADLIRAGKEVFVLDRLRGTVTLAEEMKAYDFINATSEKDETNRYEFWIEEEQEVTVNE